MSRIIHCNTDTLDAVVEKLFSRLDGFISVEAAAQTLAHGMCEEFGADRSDIVLSRVFHSFDYGLLPQDLQKVGAKALGSAPSESSKFLVLLGTYGDRPEWRQRTGSKGHQAIPLNRTTTVSIPMIARLFQQIGFDLGVVLGEKQGSMHLGGVVGSYGVFHVPVAQGSPFIPAQDFVAENGVKSVVGTGVMLPTGEISLYLAFCRVEVEEKVAAEFSALMALFWRKVFSLRNKGMF